MRPLNFRPWLLAAAAAWLAAPAGVAQQEDAGTAALPSWVVPVLRLVSATRVEPTTGVVLSADGLVLVAHEFAAAGDEIVVLDGGTDIVRNGRPARLERAFPELGLKVLAVDGLRRRAAPVATSPPADGDRVLLTAFPPAEDIAEGMAPLRQAITVALLAENATPALAAGSVLPNVTGPLLDDCGNLAGFSIADGVQTMAPSPATQYRWHAALLAVLAELGLPATGADCAAPPAPPEQEEAQEEAPQEAPPEQEQAPTTEAPAAEPLPEESPEESPEQPPEPSEEAPPETGAAEPPMSQPGPQAVESDGTHWGWLGAALAGALLLAAGFGVYRWRTRASPLSGPPREVTSGGVVGTDATDGPAAEASGGTESHRLVLRGQYADGRSLLVSAQVSERAVNLDIGRGSADLVIDSPAVSRHHARLNGTAQALTLSDLGSSNGTSINGVPCMEGEIMYLEAGDEIILGDVRFQVEVEPAPGGPGRE